MPRPIIKSRESFLHHHHRRLYAGKEIYYHLELATKYSKGINCAVNYLSSEALLHFSAMPAH